MNVKAMIISAVVGSFLAVAIVGVNQWRAAAPSPADKKLSLDAVQSASEPRAAAQVSTDAASALPKAFASWPWAYGQIADITADADIVVQGRVIANPSVDTRSGVIVSHFDFEVVATAKGDVSAGDRIEVLQTGGAIDGTGYEVADDPLFDPLDELILLLKESPDGGFWVVGGPQGRLIIDDGLVFTVGHVLDDPSILDLDSLAAAAGSSPVSGRTLASVLSEVQEHADDPPLDWKAAHDAAPQVGGSE